VSETVIRRIDAGRDRASVVDLWRTVFGYAAPHNDPESVIRKKLEVGDGLFFVTVLDSQVVGTVMAGYDGHRGWIYLLAVSPAARGRGIGAQLLRRAEIALRKLGCAKVNLQVLEDNQGVVDFYEQAGYAVERRISMGKLLDL
jgi:ribosomal protein S18 acetylase RimI-like enzyme